MTETWSEENEGKAILDIFKDVSISFAPIASAFGPIDPPGLDMLSPWGLALPCLALFVTSTSTTDISFAILYLFMGIMSACLCESPEFLGASATNRAATGNRSTPTLAQSFILYI